MPGLFQTLEIGKRALLTHQLTLQTIGHNIANVGTPGYSRQRVHVTTSMPEWSAIGVLGTGLQVSDIRHVRDLFLGAQFRQENKALGQWSYKEKILSQIESLFAEPNDNTLSQLLNAFWDSWSDLATNPNSTSHRSAILEQAHLLTNGFHELADQLSKLRDSIDRDLVHLTDEVNRLTGEIAQINHKIKSMELGGNRANDLRDARDHLLDELSNIIDVNSMEQPNGEQTVYIGAMSIVNGSTSIKIEAKVANVAGKVTHSLVWEGTSVSLKNLNGQLKGLVKSRDEIIPRYLDALNELAKSVIEEVNSLHRPGYGLNGSTGIDFFDASVTDAHNMRVNAQIEQDVAKITASGSGEVGDNTVALAIHSLRNKAVMRGNTITLNDYYNSLVGRLGVESSEAQSFTTGYELLLNQIENTRQSVQGVSLDEEMTNMIKYQHAYDAAARVITAMDQALGIVIGSMGVVGR